ncbi:MAG TPA: ATP synthase F1 subunit delta [Dictyobacter sp.]|jgi:F-type H+-transporting ATPase subunit delta|nr:ATP synthase F1 subunit delta [Dictyobacter sp.]
MLKGAIARRYAEAMFEIARRQNSIDRTLEDIKGIAELFSQRKLAYLLKEPKVPAQRKESTLRENVGPHVLPTSLNLALLIVQRELVDVMPAIAREFEQFVLDYRNQAVATVTSAAQLDESQQAVVKRMLERQTGKTIIMHTQIDPNILGGIIARVGDQVIDSSVRYRLHALHQDLLSGVASNALDFSPESLASAGK